MEFVQHNIWLIVLAAFSGFMLIFPNLRGKISGTEEVDTTGAVQLINHDNAIVLDVREANEFSSGHIADAKHIPVGQLANNLKPLEKYKDQAIVVNCRSGARSASACSILRKNGFTKVYNLKGGILAWQQANLPTVK
ncbi:rhodanese-like domain-containing protein [Sulfuriferula thiophila]|uniref:rhodanese-like domain-containing protein n=1 Tax=Sulfuriferula thiophila TaxID=1781211 RepID=UPI000F6157D9|nr:rhodanese-like domain-containing protein [Sulfuriferula thiophila]